MVSNSILSCMIETTCLACVLKIDQLLISPCAVYCAFAIDRLTSMMAENKLYMIANRTKINKQIRNPARSLFTTYRSVKSADPTKA